MRHNLLNLGDVCHTSAISFTTSITNTFYHYQLSCNMNSLLNKVSLSSLQMHCLHFWHTCRKLTRIDPDLLRSVTPLVSWADPGWFCDHFVLLPGALLAIPTTTHRFFQITLSMSSSATSCPLLQCAPKYCLFTPHCLWSTFFYPKCLNSKLT